MKNPYPSDSVASWSSASTRCPASRTSPTRSTGGSWSCRLTKCFTGHERKYIKSDYLARPEVLRYVLYRVLNMNHYELSNPAACQAMMQEYQQYNDPVRQFFADMEARLVWDAVPFEFLFDLYKAWFARNNPSGSLPGRNTFIKDLSAAVSHSAIWCVTGQVRTGNRMDKPEPLILEYKLEEWMNPNATASSNPDVVATTNPKSRIRGLLRISSTRGTKQAG